MTLDTQRSPGRTPLAWKLLVALAAGGIAAAYSARISVLRTRGEFGMPYSDFAHLWYASQKLLAGQDVYAAIGPGREFDPGWALAYPMPAILAATPFSGLTLVGADAAFAGIGVAALTFVLLGRGWWALLALLSWPMLAAVRGPQWAPLLTAAATIPWLGGLLTAKPTIGVALACYDPRGAWVRRAAMGAVLLLAASFVLQPHWVQGWLTALRTPPTYGISSARTAQAAIYEAPVTCTGGVLVLLALLRWRRPEARLLVALSLVPQTLLGYELVPIIALVPTTALQCTLMTLLSWGIIFLHGPLQPWPGNWASNLRVIGTASVWFVFLPAVLLVLRRPNDGPVPDWVDRIAHSVRARIARPDRLRRPTS